LSSVLTNFELSIYSALDGRGDLLDELTLFNGRLVHFEPRDGSLKLYEIDEKVVDGRGGELIRRELLILGGDELCDVHDAFGVFVLNNPEIVARRFRRLPGELDLWKGVLAPPNSDSGFLLDELGNELALARESSSIGLGFSNIGPLPISFENGVFDADIEKVKVFGV